MVNRILAVRWWWWYEDVEVTDELLEKTRQAVDRAWREERREKLISLVRKWGEPSISNSTERPVECAAGLYSSQ